MNTTSTDRAATASPFGDESNPPIDAQVLFSRCLGNVSLAMALVSELESSGSQQVNAMMQCAAAGNMIEAAEGAHSLKGAAAILGAQALSEKSAHAEAAGRDGQAEELLKLLQELDEEMNRCLTYIPKLRQHTQGSQ